MCNACNITHKVIRCQHLHDLDHAVDEIVPLLHPGTIAAFYGVMGAGKTTLIKAICRRMGVADKGASPSFSIVNEYRDAANNPLYHFDFYRIKDEQEVYDLGYEDYFYSGHTCFIEWPEKVEPVLPEHTLRIFIGISDPGNETRTITIEKADGTL